MTGEEFFSANRHTGEMCKKLQSIDLEQQAKWELEKVSPHSPGAVTNDELLWREVDDPTHFDRVIGDIKPTFFDDASSRGASVRRASHISADTLQRQCEARVQAANDGRPKENPREAIGYAVLRTKEVRRIAPESEAGPPRRGVGVYDTARSDDVSHADVCQLVAGKQQGRSVRAQLYQAAKGTLIRFATVKRA